MKITTLIENDLAQGIDNLKAEFGLSLYIESAKQKILFDTGSSGKFIDNAKALGIDIGSIETVVISHAHFDHTGGLKRFLKENKQAKVYISEHVKSDYYYRPISLIKKYIGIDKEMLEENMDRFVFVEANLELMQGVNIITDIKHNYKKPSDSKNLYAKKGKTFEKDSFNHELMLTVDDGGRIFVITGCSHNGILNMVDTVKQTKPDSEIIVIGGFHMFNPITKGMSEKKQDVIDIASIFKYDSNISKIITGHCTGKKAYKVLDSVLEEKLTVMNTGSSFEF